MKLFKTIDEKIEDLGFSLLYQRDAAGACYARENKEFGYTQVVDLLRKNSGRHIIQSYDMNLFDEKGIGNTCVGLTYEEARLFLKKMKKLGLTGK